ncbi:cytochrome c oxidase subunit 7A, mitochondrial-like isoform X2 [Panulirus ornatus]|uniref:cytochrome c oxidase subunit 7A, mitochondrial-like isoform X2 n=1 Tax=Panulirus ornatus TaxID=150431 RepID=UPI003A85D02A
MFYQRDSVSGRITSSPQLKTPSNLGSLPEDPGIVYSPGTVFPKDRPARKGIYDVVPRFLLQRMEQFQKHDNIPIHLKGGPIDKVLFGTSLIMCAAGLAGCFQFFYKMSFPKKAQD